MRTKFFLVVAAVSLSILQACGGGSSSSPVEIDAMCGACHGVPPLTGTHVKHFGAMAADATYGGTGATSKILPDGSSYAFDCGNCHPTDIANHMNGVPNSGGGQAEIVLDCSDAPAGSLKALNVPGAAYTPGETVETDQDSMTFTKGTCNGVYCHSAVEYSAPDPIPSPGTDFPFTSYPIIYPDYYVDSQRVFLSPQWGGAALSCGDCHSFPPRTSVPEVDAGVGDSHSWIDSYGYENMHGYNHGAPPIACATCHYNTVTEQGVRSRDASGISVYMPVPIADYSSHVNGKADIAFTIDTITYNFSTPKQMTLSDAVYESSTKTCGNVSCHIFDTSVQWGTPYRWYNQYECLSCHQY